MEASENISSSDLFSSEKEYFDGGESNRESLPESSSMIERTPSSSVVVVDQEEEEDMIARPVMSRVVGIGAKSRSNYPLEVSRERVNRESEAVLNVKLLNLSTSMGRLQPHALPSSPDASRRGLSSSQLSLDDEMRERKGVTYSDLDNTVEGTTSTNSLPPVPNVSMSDNPYKVEEGGSMTYGETTSHHHPISSSSMLSTSRPIHFSNANVNFRYSELQNLYTAWEERLNVTKIEQEKVSRDIANQMKGLHNNNVAFITIMNTSFDDVFRI